MSQKSFTTTRVNIETEDGFRLRSCGIEDLPAFNDVLMTVFYDMQLCNLACCYRASPDTFYVIEEVTTGKTVGAISLNRISESFMWQHDAVLLPAYQHRRLFSTFEPALPHAPSYGGNRNQSSLSCFRKEPLLFAHKQKGFYGQVRLARRVKASSPPGFHMATFRANNDMVDEELLAKVLQYDAEMYGNFEAPRRRQFITEWITNGNSPTVVAVALRDVDSMICGYGVAKMNLRSDGRFSPVYADDGVIATAIF
ncbi:unnamed protein product, partial [Soboliphyme baturini]|uniref:GNAT family N-acetyltransferase n=1 Tax=Soboliphyme baturini TaxID=241478 RepID=A0A183J219_9BILA